MFDLSEYAPITPINVTALQVMLEEYPDKCKAKFLVDGFKNGFKIGFTGKHESFCCGNLKSADEKLPKLRELILKEIKLGRIKGPFLKEPLPNTRVSPLGMVPKKGEDGSFTGWQKITHLSYPRKGEFGSIKGGIDPADTKVKYQLFDEAVKLCVQLGTEGYLAKSDLKSAFRQLPIHSTDLHLLGFRLDSLWFLDVCMPFGLAIACKVYEDFSTVLHWVVAKLVGDLIRHYLDDFLLGGRDQLRCQQNLRKFKQVCDHLGIPIAEDKTTLPTQIITFLGLVLNMRDQVIGIPQHKVDKALRQINYVLAAKTVRVKLLQSLTGLLNFVGKAIPGARCFNHRFYSAMVIPKDRKIHPYYHIKVAEELKEDLRVWKVALKELNFTIPFRFVVADELLDLQLYMDASPLGWGVWYQKKYWVYGAWTRTLQAEDKIALAEMLTALIALHLFIEEFQGQHVLIHVDNTNMVSWINNQTSPIPEALYLIRQLVAMSIKHQVLVKAEYMEYEANVCADHLSRLQV